MNSNKKALKLNCQAVFFDFDGVIIDSVDVKTDAFAEIFRPYGPEVQKAAVEYHLYHGGLSRYKKFEYIFNNILNREISQEKLKKLGHKFSEIALNKVINAPFMPGAFETLKKLKVKGVPAFVVSGTPDDEIKIIIQERKLHKYFIEAHGSPRDKEQIIMDIINRYGFDYEKCIFVGDAFSDYEAAKKTGLHFLGVVKDVNNSIFPEDVEVNNETVLNIWE